MRDNPTYDHEDAASSPMLLVQLEPEKPPRVTGKMPELGSPYDLNVYAAFARGFSQKLGRVR